MIFYRKSVKSASLSVTPKRNDHLKKCFVGSPPVRTEGNITRERKNRESKVKELIGQKSNIRTIYSAKRMPGHTYASDNS